MKNSMICVQNIDKMWVKCKFFTKSLHIFYEYGSITMYFSKKFTKYVNINY